MNPFSTRYVRPGALPFEFRPGESAEQLVAALAAQGWRGQIVGAHGTGKSTLLATLLPCLEQRGRSLVKFSLHDGKRRLPIDCDRHRALSPSSVLVIDGYEQLSRWSRLKTRLLCRRRRCGLLVTAHSDIGLPLLYRTVGSFEIARRIVGRLQPAGGHIAESDVRRACQAHQGDLREALFWLYDLHEQRRSQ
jgi:hypothetical protein